MDIFQPEELVEGQAYIYTTALSGLYYIKRPLYEDERGFFTEPFNVADVEALTGKQFYGRQLNYSYSRGNSLRGFHAEDWNKLITIVDGAAFCVIADIRPDSSTFGQTETFLLDSRIQHAGSLYVGRGLANAFCAMIGPVRYLYLVDKLYAERDPDGDVAINLFDPDLAVDWPIVEDWAIISDRDRQAVNLRQLYPEKFDPA